MLAILHIAQSKEFAQNELEALHCIAEPSIVLLMEAFLKVNTKFPLLLEDLHLQNASNPRHGLSQWLLLLLHGDPG